MLTSAQLSALSSIANCQLNPVARPSSTMPLLQVTVDPSLTQVLLQPSPLALPPSSQSSPISIIPLPQIGASGLLPTGVPDSNRQIVEQPSLSKIFPSSQASPYSTLALPQSER